MDPSNPIDIVFDTFYALGDLDHTNRPIFGGTAISEVTLNLLLEFDNGASATIPINVLINETTNTANVADCPSFQVSATPCDDQITLPSQPINTNIPIPNSTNFIAVDLAFDIGGQTNTIVSEEDSFNPGFTIFGAFREVPAPAPFGGLALLSLASRRVIRLRRQLRERGLLHGRAASRRAP